MAEEQLTLLGDPAGSHYIPPATVRVTSYERRPPERRVGAPRTAAAGRARPAAPPAAPLQAPSAPVETSEAAAGSIEKVAGSVRATILGWLYSREPLGGTCDAAQAELSLSHQTCSARFWEMEKTGYIHRTDFRLKTRSGRMASIYRLTTQGFAAAKQILAEAP